MVKLVDLKYFGAASSIIIYIGVRLDVLISKTEITINCRNGFGLETN